MMGRAGRSGLGLGLGAGGAPLRSGVGLAELGEFDVEFVADL
jgi:hypothetical protein